MSLRIRLALFGLAFLGLVGCSSAGSQATQNTPPAADSSTDKTATDAAPDSSKTDKSADSSAKPANMQDTQSSTATTNDNVSSKPKDGDEVAVLDTAQGQIVFKFFPDKAPKTVANFKMLANKHFYDGTKFHRIIPGFMIQGGDPNTKSGDPSTFGQGGSPDKIPAEFTDIKHVRGIVSMARTSDPNSASSQFFIVVKDSNYLDGQYAAFGYVVKGMDVADKIVNLPQSGPGNMPTNIDDAKVKSIRIEKWPLKG